MNVNVGDKVTVKSGGFMAYTGIVTAIKPHGRYVINDVWICGNDDILEVRSSKESK